MAVLVVGLVGVGVMQSLTERGKQQDREDEQEAARRNAEEQRKAQEAMSQYLAEFRAEGYDTEAAEALARKRLRDEGPSQRRWRPEDIANERREAERQQQAAAEKAERQRKIDAGEIARCPRCREYAPASQGVILAHRTEPHGTPCEGEGTILKDV